MWSKDAGSRFSYEPLVIGDEVLFFRGDRAVVAALADGRERELPVPDPRDREGKQTIPFAVGAEPLVSLSYYEGALVVVSRLDHEGAQFNYGWHPLGGRIDVLLPKPPPEPEPAKP
ncbi:MAG: hypothetical protein BWZ02_01154 [Lentisphaerae bacterium ADurb.BinA184]|nr:MAG: hypothetical protein BWZ02_01154 [Lentisphaerae bacterium ADurb.BinA184]